MNQLKLTDLTVENILFTGVSVKMQITDSISENLTNSGVESTLAIIRPQAKIDNFVFKDSNIIIEWII